MRAGLATGLLGAPPEPGVGGDDSVIRWGLSAPPSARRLDFDLADERGPSAAPDPARIRVLLLPTRSACTPLVALLSARLPVPRPETAPNS